MSEMDAVKEIEFVDNGSAPEFFINGVQDVDVLGSTSRVSLFLLKRTTAGLLYREACLFVLMPTDAIAPGAAIALRRAGCAGALPFAGGVMRKLLSH